MLYIEWGRHCLLGLHQDLKDKRETATQRDEVKGITDWKLLRTKAHGRKQHWAESKSIDSKKQEEMNLEVDRSWNMQALMAMAKILDFSPSANGRGWGLKELEENCDVTGYTL